MIKNKLIILLKSLNKKEITRFGEFVDSPYFNKHKDVRRLCGYLQQCFPDFTAKNCERTLIYQYVFGTEKKQATFDQKKLNLVFTYTLRLFEKFLTIEQLNGQQHTANLLLLKKLREKEAFVYLEKKTTKTAMLLQQDSIQDSEHYRLLYELSKEADEYHTQQSKHLKDQSIQEKQNSLDAFFISEKLKDACEMLVRGRLLKVEYTVQLLPAVEHLLDQHFEDYQNNPSIVIYHQLYQLLVSGEDLHFDRFVNILEEKVGYFTLPEQKSLYDYAQNFCVNRINEGKERFLEEYFKLNEAQFKKHLLLQSGYLLEWHYKNMVTVGLRLKKYNWIKQFIEEYKMQLHPDARDNAYCYNLSAYFYETKQYSKVLEQLGQVEFSDIRYSLGAKSILLRTFYDLSEYDPLFAHSHAFKIYLNRNKLISDNRKKGFYNLIKFTEKLAHLQSESKAQSVHKTQEMLLKIKAEIEKAQPIFNTKWLLEKIQTF